MGRFMVNPDPKPRKRHVANQIEWAMLVATLCPRGTLCFCGCGRRADSLHHLVGRGQHGDDDPDNLIPLAGDGTRLCHGALTSSNRCYDPRRGEYIEPLDVRRGIRAHLTDAHTKYVVAKKGHWFLDAYYPEPYPDPVK